MTTTTTKSQTLEVLDRLLPEQQREVLDFARFLATQSQHDEPPDQPAAKRHITGEGWFGGLADLGDHYKSGVELQHDILKDWEQCD